ncbi:hypothetical protein AAVH_11668 [Aphelenchoides avenae]|nr:hypothetical protein AAVH_11668 [Aphelenchus avenae]
MRLLLVAEDESGDYELCCGSIHAYVALLAFMPFDIGAVMLTLAVYWCYALHPDLGGTSWMTIASILALLASALTSVTGPIGMLFENTKLLGAYGWRLCVIAVFSIFWAILGFKSLKGLGAFLATGFWLASFVIYAVGMYYCRRATAFLENRYKGYDDVDPADVQKQFEYLKDTQPVARKKRSLL